VTISYPVAGSLLLAFLALWIWGLWVLVRRDRRTRSWPHAAARIISEQRWGKNDVVFQLPDGREVNTRMVMDMELVPDRTYLVGEWIMIAYDPRNPSLAEQVLSRKDLIIRLTSQILSVALAVALFVWSQSSR
jgi:hypothetical protein